MRISTTLLLPLTLSALTSSTPTHHARADNQTLVPYIVSSFGAFDSPIDSGFQSFITFHFKDPNPARLYETDCNYTPEAWNNETIYQPDPYTYIRCGASAIGFNYQKGGGVLTVSHTWKTDEGDMIAGYAPQNTSWCEKGSAGHPPNASVNAMGTFYFRSTDWIFPIATLVA